MKQSISVILVVMMGLGILFVSGCQSDKQNKALLGGAIGAGVGQIAGRDTKSTMIGAGIGAGAGYLLGKDEPKKQPPPPQTSSAQPSAADANTITVWVNNSNGSQTEVKLTRNPDGTYTGPKGERYAGIPTEEQLKKAYGF